MFSIILKNRILLILALITVNFLFSQNAEELKRFMETYDKIKVDQQANEIVKKGIESEKSDDERPVKLIVTPGDISKYYQEKLNVLRQEVSTLNSLLDYSDTIPPISYFGYNYFSKRDSIPFVDNLKITDDYVLDFGDEIIISVWGEVSQYEKKQIQRDGTIYVDNVGLLYLGGKSLANAKSYINDRFAKVYSTIRSSPQLSFLDVSIGSIKNINITVSGHVNLPGNYVVNPYTTLTSILILSGGIAETGTLRNISIIRNGIKVDSLDLYPLISGESIFKNINLFDGDIVIVPSRGKTVSITGAIRMPAYYESLDDNIASLVAFAGGMSQDATDRAFIFSRKDKNKLINVSLSDNISLFNGDSLVIPKKFFLPKYFTVSINDKKPIKIPWVENLNYDQIFKFADIELESISKIELVRKLSNHEYQSFILENYVNGEFDFLPFDHISFQLQNFNKRIETVFIRGLVKYPGVYPLRSPFENLNSMIVRSGGVMDGFSSSNITIKRDTIDIGTSDGDLILSPGDTIIVSPYNGTVLVQGEIHNPGFLEWKDTRTAKDYIELAGGLTAYGDKKHITYIDPYGEAMNISQKSKKLLQPGSKIVISQLPINEMQPSPDRLQQISSLVTSLVTIAILANTTNRSN